MHAPKQHIPAPLGTSVDLMHRQRELRAESRGPRLNLFVVQKLTGAIAVPAVDDALLPRVSKEISLITSEGLRGVEHVGVRPNA